MKGYSGMFYNDGLLFGEIYLNDAENTPLLNAIIDFILAAKRFNDSLI